MLSDIWVWYCRQSRFPVYLQVLWTHSGKSNERSSQVWLVSTEAIQSSGKTQKTEKQAKPATVVKIMRILWICGGAFSFAFALLKGNSGCPSDNALACNGLLSVGNIFPNIFWKQTIGQFLMSVFRQLFLKTNHDNIFELCLQNLSLGRLWHAGDVCRSLFFG